MVSIRITAQIVFRGTVLHFHSLSEDQCLAWHSFWFGSFYVSLLVPVISVDPALSSLSANAETGIVGGLVMVEALGDCRKAAEEGDMQVNARIHIR